MERRKTANSRWGGRQKFNWRRSRFFSGRLCAPDYAAHVRKKNVRPARKNARRQLKKRPAGIKLADQLQQKLGANKKKGKRNRRERRTTKKKQTPNAHQRKEQTQAPRTQYGPNQHGTRTNTERDPHGSPKNEIRDTTAHAERTETQRRTRTNGKSHRNHREPTRGANETTAAAEELKAPPNANRR